MACVQRIGVGENGFLFLQNSERALAEESSACAVLSLAQTQPPPQSSAHTGLPLHLSEQTQPPPQSSAQAEPQLQSSAQTQPPPPSSAQTQSQPQSSAQTQPPPQVSAQTQPPPQVSAQTHPPPPSSAQTQSQPPSSMQTQTLPPSSAQTQSQPPSSMQTQPLPPSSAQTQSQPQSSAQTGPPLQVSGQTQPPPQSSAQTQPLPQSSAQTAVPSTAQTKPSPPPASETKNKPQFKTSAQIAILEEEFNMDPTPPVAPARVHHVLERLKKTGGPALNENQVHKWFQNRRYKLKAASVTSSGQAGDKVDQDIVQASAVAEAGMQSRQDRERPLCMLLDLSRAADDLLLPGAPCDSSDAGEATQKNIVRPAYDAVVQNGPQLLACPTTELGADTGQACPGEASHTAIAKPVPGTIVKAGKRWPRDYNDTELNAELDILQELPKEKGLSLASCVTCRSKTSFKSCTASSPRRWLWRKTT